MARRPRAWRIGQIQVLVALVVAAVGLAGCTGGGDRDRPKASISVSPPAALMDEPVTVSLRGLPAGARTTVTAKAVDSAGTTWSSSAQFQATSAGEVSLGQPSLGGSYTGVNPMGLFTLMAPPPGSAPDWFLHGEAGYDITLQATVGGSMVAEATIRRQGPVAVGVVEKQLRPASGGIYGNLYLPKDTAGRRPAVLVFSGSGGGLTTSFAAALLAAHGYPTLALAYFKVPGLPRTLHDIPLEYFTSALERLRAQPGVDPRHVLVAGDSRGGEAALLLGAHFPRLVNGVVAGVPARWCIRAGPTPANRPGRSVAAPSQPSTRPSSGNPTRPGSRRRSSRSSASGARSCSPAASWTGSGRPVAMSTPSPPACAPTGSPIRSSTCAIATPATTLVASRCTSPA
jgi:pimeloyl-ACP methyl ester carboxylesterase